jgi:flagellar basal-body rod modification protein FlgD
MTTINTQNTLSGTTASTTTGSTQKLGQDQFLELMIAQLKNQDPTSPADTGQFLTQLAQFSTVSGIQSLESTVNSLATSLQSNQALLASSLVGRSVLAPGDTATIAAGGGISGTLSLANSAASVVVTVTDSAGQTVQRLYLGSQPAGTVNFNWDGTTSGGAAAPAGTYAITAQALDGKTTTALDTSIAKRVDSVSLGGSNGLVLNLSDGTTAYLSDVSQIS